MGAVIERGAIRSRGLTRRFGQRVAVRPFDLDVEPGSVVGLLGPNGSGKSTFMRMLLGLVPPDSGTASVDGIALAGEGVAVRRRCTFSPGEIGLYRELRGAEHLDWLLRGRPPAARARGRELCHALGLPLEDRVRSYSHGMKRQLLFAAAMAPQVRVRLLDEPTEGLDPERRAQIVGLIHADAAQGVTILLSSHHLGEIERACQRLLFLGSGALIADEDVATLRERTARLLLLRWPRGLATPGLEDELSSMARGSAEVLRPPPDASLLLNTPDPRPFLASLAAHPSVPQPESIQYGSLSLQDLYRELYGVEGI